MTYNSKLNNISRTKIEIVKLNLGFCQNTFGVAPCTASGGVKCYNTFPTCQDKANYINSGKTYRFISNALPVAVINVFQNVRPYVKSISDIPTEIREKDTVVKRLKVDLFDEDDNDLGIDPYYSDRGPQPGSFWKKFIQRNKNYRLGTLEYLQGFEGLPENEFQTKFKGKIDNISYGGGMAQIDSVDFLKELSKLNHPIKTNLLLTEDVGTILEANSLAAMLALNAIKFDYCRRLDFLEITLFAPSFLTGELDAGLYQCYVYAFNDLQRPVARAYFEFMIILPDGGFTGTYGSVTGATFYLVYYRNFTQTGNENIWQKTQAHGGNSFTIITNEGIGGSGPLITSAEIYYQLIDDDATLVANWEEFTDAFNILITGDSDILPSSGYIRLDKEIIFYNEKSDTALINVQRGQSETDIERHYASSWVAYLFHLDTPTNPIVALKQLLEIAGIGDASLSSRFTTYENEFGDSFKVTLKPLTKDTKFSRLFFDLVYLIDCMCWVNEDGDVDILFNEAGPGLQEITDDANIIIDSVAVDYNDTGRRTRWIVFWDKFDGEGGIDESSSYRVANVLVDTDSEGPNENNDVAEEVQFCLWMNQFTRIGAMSVTAIKNYLNLLLAKRRDRTRNAPEIVELSCELKDDDIRTGDVVLLSTKYLQDIYGADYSRVKFRVMKKENQFNRIKLKLLRKYDQTSGSEAEAES